MIVFDLQCNAGHVFEIWFGSSQDYEAQKARGLIACPYCGGTDVKKAVMAPRVAAKRNRESDGPQQALALQEAGGVKEMLAALAVAQRKLLEKSTYVGGRFAEEARAIHHGEKDERPIHGKASPQEARQLMEEGVPVAPLPFPVVDPREEN